MLSLQIAAVALPTFRGNRWIEFKNMPIKGPRHGVLDHTGKVLDRTPVGQTNCLPGPTNDYFPSTEKSAIL